MIDRTLILVSSSPDIEGGAEVCLMEMARRLPERGWTPIVVVPAEGKLSAALRELGLEVRCFDVGAPRSRTELRSPKILWRAVTAAIAGVRIARLARRRKAALIHSNSSIVVAGALGAALSGRPHIWHLREVLGGVLWPPLRAVIRRFSSRIICISEAVAQNVLGARSSDGEKVVVIRDGIDIDFFSARDCSRSTDQALRVGIVGRITPLKGHAVFLEAAKRVLAVTKEVEFHVVGGALPVYESLRKQLVTAANAPELKGHVVFRGHMGREALRKAVCDLDVVVSASVLPEGGGLALLEAMALGKAVVATRHGGPLEIVRERETGILAKARDPQSLAEAVTTLLTDDNLRRRMGNAARAWVTREHDVKNQVTLVATEYEALLQR